MVNSIEFSVDNRDALAGALLYLNGRQDGNHNKSSPTRVSACALFTQFFQVKLDSYLHLIDISKDQGPGGRGAISMEDGNDDWSPEDVILGGCTSLLLGYLMKGSSTNSAVILNALPDKSPQLLLRALAVFAAFHSQIDALTPEVAKSVLHVEDILKSFQGSGDGASDRCKRQLTDVAETAPKNAEIGIDHDKAEGKGRGG
ncbi:uncharacterized protein IUM83_01022 [Phytophthora cinnamomi]|uniref:uncharacterized protein n=1 Tax=Phytophthora cinnamomi TaxID=4785 RepID=UPI003559D939|nr:hypothetical protein IUM83_01022 [Phytophthora cinnamomi]